MVAGLAEEMRSGIVITVFSTASAVGKTLVSINLAAELARLGYRVCLADLDIQFGDVCNYLQLAPEKTLYDAQKALKDDMEQFTPLPYLTKYTHGDVSFSVLPAPVELDEAYNIVPENVKYILEQLQTHFDYLVLDTTATFSGMNLLLMDLSTIITFLGIVDFIPTIKNMKIGCDMLRQIGFEQTRFHLVLNRSNSKTRIELADVEQLLESPFYHVLPNNFASAIDSIHTGVPLVLADSLDDLGDSLRRLVAKYTNRTAEKADNKTGLGSWFKSLFDKG